jgi:hypothetical protein
VILYHKYRSSDSHSSGYEECYLLGYNTVVHWESTDILEKRVAFVVEESVKQETSMKQAESNLAVLKLEVICTSKTSVNIQWSTQHYIPEDRTFLCHKTQQISYSSPF